MVEVVEVEASWLVACFHMMKMKKIGRPKMTQ